MIVVPFSPHSILRCFISPEEHVETVSDLSRDWVAETELHVFSSEDSLSSSIAKMIVMLRSGYISGVRWVTLYNIVKTSNIFPTAKNWVKIKGSEIQLRKRKFERWYMYNMFKGRSVDLRMAVWGKWFRSWLAPCFPL